MMAPEMRAGLCWEVCKEIAATERTYDKDQTPHFRVSGNHEPMLRRLHCKSERTSNRNKTGEHKRNKRREQKPQQAAKAVADGAKHKQTNLRNTKDSA